jgi:superoxide dismutase, Fe-Mn family
MPESCIGRRAAMATLGTLGAGAIAMAGLGTWEQDGAEGERDEARRQPRPLTAEELGWDQEANQYVLPSLPYAHNALEPHIDEETMQLHHGQHHNAYVGNLNRALRRLWEIREGRGDAALTQHWLRQVSFNGSGHFNHSLFWQIMAPPDKGGGGQPGNELAEAIRSDFGSFAKFSEQFQQAARSVEGGGWAWLALDAISARLLIVQMESQQHSVLNGMVPLMGVDVWEHAYYLHYQNRRSEYVEAFMNVVNWPRVEESFALARGPMHPQSTRIGRR